MTVPKVAAVGSSDALFFRHDQHQQQEQQRQLDRMNLNSLLQQYPPSSPLESTNQNNALLSPSSLFWTQGSSHNGLPAGHPSAPLTRTGLLSILEEALRVSSWDDTLEEQEKEEQDSVTARPQEEQPSRSKSSRSPSLAAAALQERVSGPFVPSRRNSHHHSRRDPSTSSRDKRQ